MATPTVTPDVTPAPEPAAAAPSGPLTSFLAPVEPARPVKTIGSTATMAEESINDTVGGTPGKTERNSGPVREHPVGALVRAIAARIGRTGTQNKVTRQHTITESRVSGGSNQTTNANRSSRDGKNHQVGQHRTARDAKLADNNSKMQQHQGRDQRDVRSADTRASTSASRNGRDVKDHKDAKASDATTASRQDAVVHKTHRDGLDARPGKADGGKSAEAKAADAKPTKPGAAKATDAKPTTDSAEKKPDTAKATPQDKAPADKTGATAEEAPAQTPRPRTQPSREAGYHDGTRAAKVTSHVKAYRDGAKDGYADGTAEYEAEKRRMDDAKTRNALKPTTSAAKPNMAPASGTTATMPGAAKAAPATPAQPPKAPANGATADMATKPAPTQPKPTQTKAAPASGTTQAQTARPEPSPYDVDPAQNIKVDENRVNYTLDCGGNHKSLSRGEVRNLKQFERRMNEKVPRMQRVAEASKSARVTAVDHATRARRLAERCRDVEGGGRLIAKLDRLAEQADALRAKTEAVEKNAHRGAESVRALVANAEVRHGGIYKAVVDSPLTKPAERDFYKDKEGS